MSISTRYASKVCRALTIFLLVSEKKALKLTNAYVIFLSK